MSELFKCFTLQQYHWQWDWFSHSSCHQLGCSSLQTPWLLPSHNTQAETKRMRRVSLNISNNVAKDYFKIDFSPQILKIKIFKSNYIVKHFYLSLFVVEVFHGRPLIFRFPEICLLLGSQMSNWSCNFIWRMDSKNLWHLIFNNENKSLF